MPPKSEATWCGCRCTKEQMLFLKACSTFLDMADTDLTMKCIAIALPQLVFNAYSRRTELEDIRKRLELYVKTEQLKEHT